MSLCELFGISFCRYLAYGKCFDDRQNRIQIVTGQVILLVDARIQQIWLFDLGERIARWSTKAWLLKGQTPTFEGITDLKDRPISVQTGATETVTKNEKKQGCASIRFASAAAG
jgi:hypothetical protein